MYGKTDLVLLLSSIEGLSPSEFVTDVDAGVSLLSCWKKVSSVDANSFTSIDFDSPDPQLIEWFVNLIDTAGIGNSVLISVGGYTVKDWIALKVDASSGDTAKLWLSSESREMLICDVNRKRLLGITSEEYTYEGYHFELSEMIA